MAFNDFTITSLDTIKAYEPTTGAWLYTIDELQSCSISQSQETTDITGKQGRKLNTLKKNKAVKISGSNGLISLGLLATQSGSTFEDNDKAEVLWTDYLTVANGEATTTYKGTGTVGAEIKTLYSKSADGTVDRKFVQDSTTSTGKFTYDPSTKKLTFHDGDLANGTEIVVDYVRKISGSVMSNTSDEYASKATLYIDATCEDKCNAVYRMQIYIPRADFSGNWEFGMGDSQTIHSFEADALASNCGLAGSFFSWTVFGANASDAV